MSKRKYQRTVSQVVDINELAYLTGASPGVLRRAGAALFRSLAGDDPDLSKALIAACDASGVEPQHMISMMHVLALEFGRAVSTDGDEEPPSDPDNRRLPMMKRFAARARKARGAEKETMNGKGDRSL